MKWGQEKDAEGDRCVGDQQKVIQMSAVRVKDPIKRRKTKKPVAEKGMKKTPGTKDKETMSVMYKRMQGLKEGKDAAEHGAQ